MTAALRLPDKQDWTVDDLKLLPPDLFYELIDGRLILPSPTTFHQLLGVEIVLALRPGCPEGYVAVPDMSLDIDQCSEPRPDVAVIADSEMMRTPVPVDKAILVVEIVSPTSHFRDMHAKTKVYAAAGLKHYWVIDPTFSHGLVLTEFQPGGNGDYEIVSNTSEIFETDEPFPVKINLLALTALRNKYLAAQEES
ncbi:Uma2 family endonuclease [Actinoplanes palleronii]|nr:Uma2 family endonuclease [Actinoplanes palleronii]